MPLVTELDEEFNLVDVAATLMNILYNKEVSFDYTENSIASAVNNRIRLFITVGRMDRLNPKMLLQFLNETAKVDREDVGDIDILEKFTFIDVTERVADTIMKRCIGRKLCGRKVNIEISRPKS